MNTNKKLFRSITILALATAGTLLIPLVAMQFTDDVVWKLGDFIFAGTFIFGSGLSYILITRKSEKMAYRIAVGFALATGLLLIWAEAAVGLIGAPGGPAGLMELGVVALGISGAILVRFEPNGMVRLLLHIVVAQTLITVVALLEGMQHFPGSSVLEIIGVNGFFITLFVVSAFLFKNAVTEKNKSGRSNH